MQFDPGEPPLAVDAHHQVVGLGSVAHPSATSMAPLASPGATGSSCRLAQRQRTAERERLLLRELHHRSSNLFVVVHAIVSRTLTGDLPIDEVREAL